MTDSPKYDADYFIAKFDAIPEEKWTTQLFNGPDDTHCALGHCGSSKSGHKNEGYALLDIFWVYLSTSPARVNDGHDANYQQPNPKQRILAALKDIKTKETV